MAKGIEGRPTKEARRSSLEPKGSGGVKLPRNSMMEGWRKQGGKGLGRKRLW